MIKWLLSLLTSKRLDYLIKTTAGWADLKNFPKEVIPEMEALAKLEDIYRQGIYEEEK